MLSASISAACVGPEEEVALPQTKDPSQRHSAAFGRNQDFVLVLALLVALVVVLTRPFEGEGDDEDGRVVAARQGINH